MSWRALGRQWNAQRLNRGRPWIPGTPERPQGRLFGAQEGGQLPLHSPQTKEALRRKAVGEPNPAHNWHAPWLQWAFPRPGERKVTQRKLDL
ncbi:MAG TPA: hypothetical protein VFI41_05070 [Gemmatimonadales bacterium]|nr:hypothetical protein [Gemmatimonadales bacterium]